MGSRRRAASGARLAILTRHDDFHAYVFRHVLASRGINCSIVVTNGLAGTGGMSWSTTAEIAEAVVRDDNGDEVRVRDLHAIWWRRISGPPQIPRALDEAARELVVSDCRATLLGMLLTDFRGRWISHPEATRMAQNKLLQLRLAQRAGLRVPRTLVSQDPGIVRGFCEELQYQVVVKTVQGTPNNPVMTGMVTPELVALDEAVTISPAIYQEFVPGTQHLRICCFGDAIHTALIETDRLDWRYPLDADIRPHRLDPSTEAALQSVLSALHLRMGIVDMKLGPGGEPIWLEVNPQGQFLFLEGMCNELQLTQLFADFLEREVTEAAAAHSRGNVPAPLEAEVGLGLGVA